MRVCIVACVGLLEQLNEDGTATIQRFDVVNKVVQGLSFKIPTTKLSSFSPDQLNTAHGQEAIVGIGVNTLLMTLKALTQNRIQFADQKSHNDSIAKKLYYLKLLRPFKTKFTIRHEDLYSWTTSVDAFAAEFSSVPRDMVFDKILQSLDRSNNAAWHEYRVLKYRNVYLESLDNLVEESDIVRMQLCNHSQNIRNELKKVSGL